MSVGYWKKKLQILLVKTVVFVKGVLERKKFQIFLAKTVVSVKGVLEDEKVSDSFVQNGTSCPLGSEGKKLPKKRTTSPVFVQ